MATLLPLIFETTSNQLAFSTQGPIGFSIPPLKQEMQVALSVDAIKRISQFSAPLFERISLAGYSLTVAIGTAGNQLAAQNVFTASADGYTLSGILNLNTAGIALLTDMQPGIYLEILLSNATENYGARFDCVVKKAVIVAAALTTPASDVALGKLEATRVFVLREGPPGAGIVLTSPDGTQRGILTWTNEGTLNAEAIT